MIPVKILAVRYLANASPALAEGLGAPKGYRCLGMLTTDSDDATYIALDAATKAAEVTVCYGRSFYAGAANASTPNAGEVIGYSVSFTDGSDLTIECPADGKDGYVGKPGERAQVPSIGKVQHEGKDCWTIGGELVRDEEGNPVPLYAYEGGEKTDGRTPQMKVEEGRWYYRLAETDQWTPVAVSVIYGDGNLFASVQEDGDNVVFNLSAGGSLTLKKVKFFSMRLETLSASVKAGNDIEVSYFLTAEDTQVEVEAFAPVGWAVTVSEGKILVSAPADAAAGTSVQVVVFATGSDGESVYQVLNITVEEA